MSDLSKYSDAELMALYQGEPAKPSRSFLEDIFYGGGTQVQKRGVGMIQAGMEAMNLEDNFPETYSATQKAAKRLNEEMDSTGAGGFVGSAVADPINLLLGPMVAGRGLLGLAGMGALGGATSGATNAYEKGQSRAKGTAIQGTVGAVAAPVLAIGGKAAGRAIEKYAVNPLRDVYTKAAQWMASNADDAIALEIRGLTSPEDVARAIAGMAEDAKMAFKQASKAGLSQKDAYLAAKATEKGITIPRGDLLQDPALQRMQDRALMGTLGENASQVARGAEATNKAAMRDYAGELLATISDNPNALTDETSVADAVARAVKTKASELHKTGSDAFTLGSQTKAKINIELLKDLPSSTRRTLAAEGFDVAAMPTLQRHLGTMQKAVKVFEKRGGSINYQGADVFRKRLFKAYDSAADPAEKEALRRLYGNYTDRLDDVITNGLLTNPDDAAMALKGAPALWKRYKQTIFGSDGKSALGKIATKNLTDREIAGFFGSGVFGKGDTVRVVQQLKGALGDTAPEVGQVRGMFFNRLLNGALDKGDDAVFGTRIKADLSKLKVNNRELYDELFTPDMQKGIEEFTEIAYRLGNKVKSKTNPSGSGVEVGDLALGLMRRMGMAGSALADITTVLSGDAGKSAEAGKAIQSILRPLVNIGSDTRVISNALKNAGATAGAGGGKSLGVMFNRPAQEQPTVGASPYSDYSDEELMQMLNQPTLPAVIPDTPVSGNFTQQQEGLRLSAYTDTAGNPTVGYGNNLNSPVTKQAWKTAGIQTPYADVYKGRAAITPDEAANLHYASQQIAFNDAADLFPTLAKMPEGRQMALVDLSYQLGKPNLAKFGGMISAINKGDYITAVKHLKKSELWKQTPERAKRVARMILTGKVVTA